MSEETKPCTKFSIHISGGCDCMNEPLEIKLPEEPVTLTDKERQILTAWEVGWTMGEQLLPVGITYHESCALFAKLKLKGSPAVAHSGWLLEIHAKTEPEWTPEKIRERLVEVHGEHECKQGLKRTLQAVPAGNVNITTQTYKVHGA